MRERTSLMQFFTVLVLLTSMAFFGCDPKADKTDEAQDGVKTEQVNPDTTPDGPEPIAEEQVEETKVTIADITGKWTGTFDKRQTVLNITEQTDSNFTGKISISYREAINQDVNGSFSPTTMKITMSDQLHSRFRGKYKGKLSEDGKNFSGTFTMDLDGKQFSFNLNKK